jgi:hypothetical protein
MRLGTQLTKLQLMLRPRTAAKISCVANMSSEQNNPKKKADWLLHMVGQVRKIAFLSLSRRVRRIF